MGSSQGTTEERVVAYRVKFSGRAAREVGEAYEWYEDSQRPQSQAVAQ